MPELTSAAFLTARVAIIGAVNALVLTAKARNTATKDFIVALLIDS